MYIQEQEVDLRELLFFLWKNAAKILTVAILGGLIALILSTYVIEPQYASTVKLYVNNKTNASTEVLTSSDIVAAQQLVGTYVAIIESDSMLEDVAEYAGLSYLPGEIRSMMTAGAINNTEVFSVKIESGNAEESAKIANSIAVLSPEKITNIVEGSSVKVVDRAKISATAVSPNKKINVIIGMFLGAMLSGLFYMIVAFLDTNIRDEEDIKAITDLPVIGVITDYNQAMEKKQL